MPGSSTLDVDAAETFGSAALNREDLEDVIRQVTPKATPLLSGADTIKVTSTKHEWPVDELGDISFSGRRESEDFTDFKNQHESLFRMDNRIQSFPETYNVTLVQQAVATAGLSDQIAASKTKAVLRQKIAVESCIGSDNDKQTATAAVNDKMRALGDWIDSSGPSDVDAKYRTPSGSINATATASLTEALVQGVIGSVYEQTGEQDQVMRLVAGRVLKRAVSDFQRASAATYQVTQMAGDKTITLDVRTLDTDAGLIHIIPTNYNGRAEKTAPTAASRVRGYLYFPDMLKLGVLIPPFIQELEDQGGGPRGFLDWVVTIVPANMLAFAKFNATS